MSIGVLHAGTWTLVLAWLVTRCFCKRNLRTSNPLRRESWSLLFCASSSLLWLSLVLHFEMRRSGQTASQLTSPAVSKIFRMHMLTMPVIRMLCLRAGPFVLTVQAVQHYMPLLDLSQDSWCLAYIPRKLHRSIAGLAPRYRTIGSNVRYISSNGK
jgi:hypothetical protein